MRIKELAKNLPNKVRITRKAVYEVLFTDAFLNDNTQLGECRSAEPKQILIKNQQSDTEKVKTLIHEVLHSISFETEGLNLTEKQVSLLEDGIFRILKLNGLLK